MAKNTKAEHRVYVNNPSAVFWIRTRMMRQELPFEYTDWHWLHHSWIIVWALDHLNMPKIRNYWKFTARVTRMNIQGI